MTLLTMIMNRCAALVLCALLAIPLSACAKKDGKFRNGQHIEVSGTVRRVGNEPWTEVVISDIDDNDWYIAANEAAYFSMYLQKTVTVRGTLNLTDIVLANNKHIGIRRELSNVDLIR
ncbi:MAG: hypothetical protein LBD22_05930 [Spirochaetaceae bacterium]|nr:hypothetical protein [Spirochaetaceae bacterium]